MAKRNPVTLVAPNGNEHTISDPIEITNLMARGYVVKRPPKRAAVVLDKAVIPDNK